MVAQMVKNLSAVQETQIRSLGQENPLEKEKATHSSILAWEISWTVEHGKATIHGFTKELDMTERLTFTQVMLLLLSHFSRVRLCMTP